MSTYYCHSCAVKLGLITPTTTANLTGCNYQLEKFIKHTTPIGSYSINSIFDDPNYSKYRDYTISGSLSGCLEIDDKGRKNLLWYAAEQVGLTYSGAFTVPASGIKIVFHDNDTRIHTYPFNPPEVKYCKECNTLIPY
jgi:hypothetical protein